MPPKKTPNELAPAQQELSSHQKRSIWGDAHAATEDAMLAAHAKHLHENGIIDDTMAAELSKPRCDLKEFTVNYTPAYLATHPNYTGKNHDDMPTLEEALRIQKAKDKEQLKFIRDFQARKIDEWGNPIARQHVPAAMALTKDGGDAKQPKVITPIKTSMEFGVAGGCQTDVTMEGDENADKHNESTPNCAPATTSSPKKNPSSTTPKAPKPIKRDPKARKPTPSTTTSSSTSTKKTPLRHRPKRHVVPLTPLSNHPSYAHIHYYDLLDLCRKRDLPGGGNVQEVRNTLIRDDINAAQGMERDMLKKKRGLRKEYKHGLSSEESSGAEMKEKTESELWSRRERGVGGDPESREKRA